MVVHETRPTQASASKAAHLRALLAGTSVVRAVGAHNGLTAKLVERAGFEAVWASSFEISASHGLPDASLVTMTQHLDATTAMDAVTDIPVIADCDTGFGGPLNVAYAMRCYERVGIAALCIEDKLFPKMNSFAELSSGTAARRGVRAQNKERQGGTGRPGHPAHRADRSTDRRQGSVRGT